MTIYTKHSIISASNRTKESESMAYQNHKESTRRAIAKYDAKTYKKITLRLRYDEDADIINSLEEATNNGMKAREWLRSLYGGKDGK